MSLHNIYIFFSFIFGACFGSFVTLVSYRLPFNEDIFLKNSYCDFCKKKLSSFSLIPILSYIIQKGRCNFCGKKISIRYFLIEISTAILFVLSYIHFGTTFYTIIFDLIITTCMIMVVTDLEHKLIFDSIQLIFLVLNLIYILYENYTELLVSVFFLVIYFLVFYFISYIVKKYKKKESIGGADLKFVAIAGLLLREKFHIFLFLSGLFGVIFAIFWKKYKKEEYFPFGPSLILSYILITLNFNL